MNDTTLFHDTVYVMQSLCTFTIYIYIYIYIYERETSVSMCYTITVKQKTQRLLVYILNKKHIFNHHKYFGCFT